MIPIQERNRQILQMRQDGIGRKAVANQFNISPTRVAQLERRDRADRCMAERRVRLREEIRRADDLEVLWHINDPVDAIGLIVVTKKRLLDHFLEVGKDRISLRELMDMCLESPPDRWGFTTPPLLKVYGIGSKGFWSVVNGLTNMGLGKRCEEAWQGKLAKVKKWARITGATPYSAAGQ